MPKGKGISLLINLTPKPDLWPWGLGSDYKNKVLDSNSEDELLLLMAEHCSKDEDVRSSREVFWVCQMEKRPQGRPRTKWGDVISLLA